MSRRDYYKRAINKHLQELVDDVNNGQRFSRKDEKAAANGRQTNKDVQLDLKINDFITNGANYLIQGDLIVFCDRFSDRLIFVDSNREHVYFKIYETDINAEDSIYRGLKKAFEDAERFTQELYFKGKKINIPRAQWVDSKINSPYGVQLDFRDGGYVDRGSHRHVDCINALLTRHEFVITRTAMRGLGRGSYELATAILYQMMKQWEREAKHYAHRR